ncbi:hypothetical protein BH11CYA1_BH11CYA1_00810 [soil metagenome]
MRRFGFTSSLSLLAALVLAATVSSASCLGQKSSARKLVFPSQVSLGRLYVYQDLYNPRFFPNSKKIAESLGRFAGEAKGAVQVKVPQSGVVYLIGSYQLAEKPEVLSTLEPNTVDCLSFAGAGIMAEMKTAIKPLSHLTGLRYLELSMAELTDDSLVDLKTLVNLERLNLFMAGINGTCFRQLGTLRKLHTLELTSNMLDPKAFGYISKLQSLENLHLSRCGVKDGDLIEIAKLPKLKFLVLSQNLITAKSLTQIAKIKTLRFLTLTNTKLSTRDLLILKGTQLSTINLPEVNYSAQDMALLRAAMPHTKLITHSTAVGDYEKTLYGPLH